MAITKWDEYLIHQTYDTIDTGEVAVDRFYFGCHNPEGTFQLAMGLGSYPKANIMDGYFCVRHEGIQHNLRLSRHLQDDRADTQIGPLSVEVIEPLKRWGIYLGENDYDISCSVEFESQVPPCLSKMSAMPFVHYNQPGRYTGSITLGNREFNVDGFTGARDRSWRAPNKGTQVLGHGHFWMVAQFAHSWLSLLGNPVWEGPEEDFSGAILNDDGSIFPIAELRHRIEFMPAARALSKVELLLKDSDGKERQVIAQPIGAPALSMAGAGYERQGEDKGPLSVEGEQWDVSQPAEVGSPGYGEVGMSQYISKFDLEGESGMGILEVSYCQDKDREYKPTY